MRSTRPPPRWRRRPPRRWRGWRWWVAWPSARTRLQDDTEDAAHAQVLDVVVEPPSVAYDVGEHPVERAEQRQPAIEAVLVLLQQRQDLVEAVQQRSDRLLVV